MSRVSMKRLHACALVGLSGLLIASLAAPPVAVAAKKQSGHVGAGGRAVAHLPGGKKVNAGNEPTALLFRLGVPAAEPTLGITHEGTIFYTAADVRGAFRVEVLASDDDARSWRFVSPRIQGNNAHPITADPYIFVDRLPDKDNSRIFNIDLTVACSYLSFSDDLGATWTHNPLACGRPVNDHQTLFAGPPVTSSPVGYPHIVYYCWNDVATSSCARSLDGGVSFHPTGTPPYPGVDPGAGGLCGGLHGHGYVGPDGTVYIPKGHCNQPWLSFSKDEGRTWTRVQVAGNGMSYHESTVAADDKGNVYYAWVAEDRLPYFAVSKDGGNKWSKPMMIGPPGLTESNLPSLDIGAPGKVAIAYMGTTNAKGEVGQRNYENVTWNGYMTMTVNALDATPTFYSAPINDPDDPLIIGNCGPGRCKAEYDFIDIVVAPDGTAYSAFVDGCTALCSDVRADSGSEGIVGRLVGGPKLR